MVENQETEQYPVEFPYIKPPEASWTQKFGRFVFNSDEGTILGRTFIGWLQLLAFYTLFYFSLAGLVAICFQGLNFTLDERIPKLQGADGLIGTNPGLAFRPVDDDITLIRYNINHPDSREMWTRSLDEFFVDYKRGHANRDYCDVNTEPQPGKVCSVDIDSFGPCVHDNSYGYNSTSPCIFLKLNRIYGWIPKSYKYAQDFPEDMPNDLKHNIMSLMNNGTATQKSNQIWVSCEGEGPADRENLQSPFEYYPHRFFPACYYPYFNYEGYLSPLVAVQIGHITPNIIVNIECRVWAENIQYSTGLIRKGSTVISVRVDKDTN